MLPLCHMADFGTFTVTGASKTVTLPAWWCAGPTDWSCSLISVQILSRGSSQAAWSVSPVFDPLAKKMERRSAFRTLVLPVCVIICSNVLCPVGAYLYNNRYAGWVKTPSPPPPPIHSWVARGCPAGERALLKKRTAQVFFCRELHAKNGLYLAQRGSLCSPPYCLGLCSRLRHNNDVFSLLCWSCCLMVFGNKTASELQRDALKVLIGADLAMSNCLNCLITKILYFAMFLSFKTCFIV